MDNIFTFVQCDENFICILSIQDRQEIVDHLLVARLQMFMHSCT